MKLAIFRYLAESTLLLPPEKLPLGIVGLMVMNPTRSRSGLAGVPVGLEMKGRKARPALVFIICMRER